MVHQLLLTPERFRSENHAGADWIRKYISPGSFTPSLSQFLQAASEKADFCVRRLEDIGLSYARTLSAWRQRFESHLPEVKALGFDESFIRSWRYYLSYAEAVFQHGLLTAAQLTMTRPTQRGEEPEQKPFHADANTGMLID
jgi:cyclopropane-fatty-acyl-phospholipid synthase